MRVLEYKNITGNNIVKIARILVPDKGKLLTNDGGATTTNSVLLKTDDYSEWYEIDAPLTEDEENI